MAQLRVPLWRNVRMAVKKFYIHFLVSARKEKVCFPEIFNKNPFCCTIKESLMGIFLFDRIANMVTQMITNFED